VTRVDHIFQNSSSGPMFCVEGIPASASSFVVQAMYRSQVTGDLVMRATDPDVVAGPLFPSSVAECPAGTDLMVWSGHDDLPFQQQEQMWTVWFN
jgi:hypothetical protein